MPRRTVAAFAALAATFPVLACSAQTTTDEQTYQIDQTVTGVAIGARAAAVTIDAGDGPVTVTEVHRYSGDRPRTAHRLDGQTLTLTESGCGDDDEGCHVEYRIRMPRGTTADVTAQAGAVKVTGLAGNVHITTEAGAVEGKALAGDEVIVQTQAGAASLEFAEAPKLVRAATEVGAVELRVPGDATYAVTVGTDLGKADVSVRRDPASAHRIDVHTQVGTVQIAPLA